MAARLQQIYRDKIAPELAEKFMKIVSLAPEVL